MVFFCIKIGKGLRMSKKSSTFAAQKSENKYKNKQIRKQTYTQIYNYENLQPKYIQL
jgi:hypothetical protein